MVAHRHGSEAADVPLRVRRALAMSAAALAVLTIIGMVLLWPRNGVSDRLREIGLGAPTYDGRVVFVDAERPCPTFGADESEVAPASESEVEPAPASEPEPEGDVLREGAPQTLCPVATVEILGGPDKGKRADIDLPFLDETQFDRGERLVLNRTDTDGEITYSFADRNRKSMLFALAVVFALAVLLLGRLRGAAALAGLVASGLVLFVFVLPAILDGRSPVLVAVVGAAAIAFVALYMAHGAGPMTTVALLGTLASLVLTLVLAVVFTELGRFSGFVERRGVNRHLGRRPD